MRITRLAYLIANTSSPHYELAAQAHVHPTTFSAYVRGSRPILDSHLERICGVVGSTDVCGWIELVVRGGR